MPTPLDVRQWLTTETAARQLEISAAARRLAGAGTLGRIIVTPRGWLYDPDRVAHVAPQAQGRNATSAR
jgi:hypothetical protein